MVTFVARAMLTLVFTTAAVGKLTDPAGGKRALADFRVPRRLVVPVSWLLPVAELTVAVLLLVQPSACAAAVAAAAMLVLFMVGIGGAMARGEAPDCNCFGQIGSAPAGIGTLVRNALLAAVAVLVAIAGPGTNPGSWFARTTGAEIAGLALAMLTIAFAAGVVALRAERRRLRADLSSAQTSLSLFPPGLPVGVDAPGFSLTATDGTVVTLDDLVARRRPVALVFSSPSCRPCHHMFPDIARWQRSLSDRLTIVVITHGPLEAARDISAEFALENVLADPEAGVFKVYRGTGTPSMVIVTPEGRVGIRIRSSHGAVEAAIRRALEEHPPTFDEARPKADSAMPFEVSRWPGRRDVQPV